MNDLYTYSIAVNVEFSGAQDLVLEVGSGRTYNLDPGMNTIEVLAPPSGATDLSIHCASGSPQTSFGVKLFKLTEHIPPSIDISYTVNHVVDYYPYGKVVREFVEGEKERYLTTQHERDEETGLDYRGARYYDSDVARFLSLDPHASKYPALSAYNYVAGNPLKYIDEDGKDITFPAELRSFVTLVVKNTQKDLSQSAVVKNNISLVSRSGKVAFGDGRDQKRAERIIKKFSDSEDNGKRELATFYSLILSTSDNVHVDFGENTVNSDRTVNKVEHTDKNISVDKEIYDRFNGIDTDHNTANVRTDIMPKVETALKKIIDNKTEGSPKSEDYDKGKEKEKENGNKKRKPRDRTRYDPSRPKGNRYE